MKIVAFAESRCKDRHRSWALGRHFGHFLDTFSRCSVRVICRFGWSYAISKNWNALWWFRWSILGFWFAKNYWPSLNWSFVQQVHAKLILIRTVFQITEFCLKIHFEWRASHPRPDRCWGSVGVLIYVRNSLVVTKIFGIQINFGHKQNWYECVRRSKQLLILIVIND